MTNYGEVAKQSRELHIREYLTAYWGTVTALKEMELLDVDDPAAKEALTLDMQVAETAARALGATDEQIAERRKDVIRFAAHHALQETQRAS